MVRRLIEWAVHSPLIVILLTLVLVVVGGYAFIHVNVEAYPDPAPAIIEVIAQFPGASAEEVERQVTIPLEIVLAGMPGLKYTRSKSLAGLAHLRNQFDYGIEFNRARQEVLNRLQIVQQLPTGVVPLISPQSPTGEILRYTLINPKDPLGRPIYTLNDLKSLQDWTLTRSFRRVPRIADVVGSGGTVKRYEIQPDPDRLKRYGITLQQLQTAVANSNANVGGDQLVQGPTVKNVRGIGLIGQGKDPFLNVFTLAQPREASRLLRNEENRRLQEIREIVVMSVNNVPICVQDVVDGGPQRELAANGPDRGVVVSHQTRMGKVGMVRPRKNEQGEILHDGDGKPLWMEEDEVIQGIVLLRKGEASLPALVDVKERIRELNETPGALLPGVKIEPYYDRTELIGITTETVRENLALGMALVTVILLMFLNDVRSALIVAINIPLALLFAFAVLFLRGRSANLLSIGAVDFGIIVDSTVIVVENIYRLLSTGEHAEAPLKDRIIRGSQEVERSLFFSTIIMVCALLPLFTMQGPEGQIFGPMADTYAFALGGALLLALTTSPVLCLLLFRKLKRRRENILVRSVKAIYLWQLGLLLRFRRLTIIGFAVVLVGSAALVPFLGREFMPELEEGNLWIRGIFPANASLDEVAAKANTARNIMRSYPEIELVVNQIGRPDDGTDPEGFYKSEYFVPLKQQKDWPLLLPEDGWKRRLNPLRPRTKQELVAAMSSELETGLPGIDWNFSQNIRDNVMESLSGVKGDNSVKIFGPDLDELERRAESVKNTLNTIRGIESVGVFRIKGQPNLEFPIDRHKCMQWGVSVADVEAVIKTAVGGQAFSQMIEGEKTFDITLRWPKELRSSEDAILHIPVDLSNNIVLPSFVPTTSATTQSGASVGVSTTGSAAAMPSLTGSQYNANMNNIANAPRRRLGDLVTPMAADGGLDPLGSFTRPGASTIYREQGNRLIAIKFSVRGRDLASAVAEAQAKTAQFFGGPFRAEWSGEFQEMEEAEHRLLTVLAVSMVLIMILLYLAFHSTLDALVVISNVAAMGVGGIWALFVMRISLNISAAVGFISILGVAVMNGLLMVSAFNHLRFEGLPLREALFNGMGRLIRPVAMTALAAIFGLLPAAISTRIGAQSQQPLAIVVVGGMITTLLFANLVPVLYSFYGHRAPPAGAGDMAH